MLALFGVKLRGKQVSLLNSCTEGFLAVVAGCGDDFGVYASRIIRVDEIEVGRGVKIHPVRRVFFRVAGGIPSHVRDLNVFAGESFDGSRDDSQSGSTDRFFAGLKKELKADTNPKVGSSCRDPFLKRLS